MGKQQRSFAAAASRVEHCGRWGWRSCRSRRLWVWLCGHSSQLSPHRTRTGIVRHSPLLTLTATSAPITTATRCTVPEPDSNSIAEFSRKPRRSQLPSTSLLVSPQSEKRRGRQGGRQGGRGPAAAGALGADSPNAPRGWPAPLPGHGAHCLRTRAADVP